MWSTQHCKLLGMTSAVRRTRQNVLDGAIANIPIEKHSIIIQLWCEAVMNQLIPIIISARKINRETAPNKSSAVSIFAIDEAATTMMSWARFFCCLLFSDEFIECRVEVFFIATFPPSRCLLKSPKNLGNCFLGFGIEPYDDDSTRKKPNNWRKRIYDCRICLHDDESCKDS